MYKYVNLKDWCMGLSLTMYIKNGKISKAKSKDGRKIYVNF